MSLDLSFLGSFLRRHRRPLVGLLLVLVLLDVSRQVGYRLYPFPYREAVAQRAKQYGVDPLLVAAVIQVESHWQSRATSGRGARGLLQVMPETGDWVASQIGIPDFSTDLLYSPEYSVWIGAWYLTYLLREFGGDEVLALAAYNAGQAHVRRWLAEAQWTGEGNRLDEIPFGETRQFVMRVQKAHRWYRLLYRPDGTRRF